jgi:hypothetical protein
MGSNDFPVEFRGAVGQSLSAIGMLQQLSNRTQKAIILRPTRPKLAHHPRSGP